MSMAESVTNLKNQENIKNQENQEELENTKNKKVLKDFAILFSKSIKIILLKI